MGNLVFPTLPGLTFGQSKQPEWKTNIHKAVSGKEFRSAWMSAPLYTFRLQYEFLRDAAAIAELQQLIAFFNNTRGSFDSFLYSDPTDNSVTSQQFGVGNGVQAAFQLVRGFGGNTEAVGNLSDNPKIYKLDWQGARIQRSTARINQVYFSEVGGIFYSTNSPALAPVSDVTASNPAYPSGGKVWKITNAGYPFGQCNLANYAGTSKASIQVGLLRNQGNLRLVFSWYTYLVVQVDVDTNGGVLSGASASISNLKIDNAGSYWVVSFTVPPNDGVSRTPILQLHMRQTLTAGDTAIYAGVQLEFEDEAGSYIASSSPFIDYGLSQTGLVTFTAAPANGAVLTWTGNYYYRCRFLQDSVEFSKFLTGLWEAKKVEFIGSLTPNRI